MALIELGKSNAEISRSTGVPKSTVGAWRHGRGTRIHRRVATATAAWRPKAPSAYCYLLGVYLGDGCISVQSQGSAVLVVVLDSRYPDIVARVEVAITCVFPDTPVNRFHRMGGSATLLQARHPALPFAFPQHGPGQKHTRPIKLVAWQRALAERYRRELLQGLIHSDGCRTVNRFDTRLPSGRVAHYEYPRYFFSNLSPDIRGLFCEHCDSLGIRWTQSNPRNISISHRDSVALLDAFVGPKS